MAELGDDNLGFVKLFRKLERWEWYTDIPVKVLFIHCLIKARHYSINWKGVQLDQGQFPTGISKLSVETGLTYSQVRTALDKLELTNEVAIKATNKGTILTVVNYSTYHSEEGDSDKQIANESQTDRKQIANKSQLLKKDKKDKKGKKDKNKEKDLYLDFVKLTKDEHEKLVKRFGEKGTEDRIWKLNDYGHRKKKKFNEYTDHYRTILNWEGRKNNGKDNRGRKQEPVKKAETKSSYVPGRNTTITIED